MMQRCNDPNSVNYDRYGGIGVRVCEQWSSFEAFYADMGDRPEGYSLERIDVTKGYEPGNCKWIPRAEQARNTRKTRWVLLNGEKMIQADAARRLGVRAWKIQEWRQDPSKAPLGVCIENATA